jgi:hypothetical protein
MPTRTPVISSITRAQIFDIVKGRFPVELRNATMITGKNNIRVNMTAQK